MSEGRVERHLAAIMAVDVVGYSRLMGIDEEGTLAGLKAIRRELTDPKIAEHRGRIVKTIGDGLLVEFASVVDAVRCAVEVQEGMAGRNADVPDDKRIAFRFGIHQGDIIIDDGDIFGDGVNVAARLEALADPGGICISARVQEDVTGRLNLDFDDLGEQSLKNIFRPIHTFRVKTTTTGTKEISKHAPVADRQSSDWAIPRPSGASFFSVLLALGSAVVTYILTAKIFGIFLTGIELIGIWVALILGFWLLRRLGYLLHTHSSRSDARSGEAVSARKVLR
jgi:class 3 adenylate cyclase